MKKLLMATVAVLALGAFAVPPALADQGGNPNSSSDGAAADSNAHGANGKNSGNQGSGAGASGDPQGSRGNDS